MQKKTGSAGGGAGGERRRPCRRTAPRPAARVDRLGASSSPPCLPFAGSPHRGLPARRRHASPPRGLPRCRPITRASAQPLVSCHASGRRSRGPIGKLGGAGARRRGGRSRGPVGELRGAGARRRGRREAARSRQGKWRERKGKGNGRDTVAVEDKHVSVGPTTWTGQSTLRCPTSGRP